MCLAAFSKLAKDADYTVLYQCAISNAGDYLQQDKVRLLPFLGKTV